MWWYLLGGLGTIAAIAAVIIVWKTIDKKTIREEVHKRDADAFRAMILRKKKNAVDVGIFAKNEKEPFETISIKSTVGVNDSLHEGQTIYI